MEIKVGDRVRVRPPKDELWKFTGAPNFHGKVGVVGRVHGGYLTLCDFEGISGTLTIKPDGVELVESALTLNGYQEQALVTAQKQDPKDQLANMALGLAGEAGETADHIKKHLFHGHELDKKHLSKEIGDVLWYIAMLSDAVGIKLEDVARGNLAKLNRRYGDEFTKDKSVNRPQGD